MRESPQQSVTMGYGPAADGMRRVRIKRPVDPRTGQLADTVHVVLEDRGFDIESVMVPSDVWQLAVAAWARMVGDEPDSTRARATDPPLLAQPDHAPAPPPIPTEPTEPTEDVADRVHVVQPLVDAPTVLRLQAHVNASAYMDCGCTVLQFSSGSSSSYCTAHARTAADVAPATIDDTR